MEIKSNEEWMSLIRKKAKERGISVKDMIVIDAKFSVSKDESKN